MMSWLTWDRLGQALLLVLTLATVGSFLGGLVWWLDVAADLRLQFAAGAAVLLLAALVARRGKALVLALVLLGLNASTVAPHIAPASGAPAKMKVVEFNLHLRNTDTAATLDFLRREDADMVVLEEVTAAWRQALEQLSDIYPHRFYSPPSVVPGFPPTSIGLFAKRPWEETGLERDDASNWIFAVWARFPAASPSLTVAGVHLMNPVFPRGRDQERDLEALASAVERFDGTVIVAGDFNMTPFSARYTRFLRKSGLRRAGGGLNATWPESLGYLALPIDHVLVGNRIRNAAMRTGPPLGSNHLPVVGTFDLEK